MTGGSPFGDPPQPALPPSGPLVLGAGWKWPGIVAAIFVFLLYLPIHGPSAGGVEQLAAAAAALYVLALSVASIRVARALVLRLGGSRTPVALWGHGADALTSPAMGGRWRVAAVIAGMFTALVSAVAADLVSRSVDPAGYPHAVASLALAVNVGLAAASVTPVPGVAGWALLLAVVDSLGTAPERRVRLAAGLARRIGVPILLAVAAAGAAGGDAIVAFGGASLSGMAWLEAGFAVERDLAARFLRGHRAADLARPLTSHARPDELVDDLRARLARQSDVTAVEAGGWIVGAIGPLQVASRRAGAREINCGEVMVPLASLNVVAGGSSALELLPSLARFGFALVADPDGLGYVEALDMERQIRVWGTLRDRPHCRTRGRRSTS